MCGTVMSGPADYVLSSFRLFQAYTFLLRDYVNCKCSLLVSIVNRRQQNSFKFAWGLVRVSCGKEP